MRRSRLLHTLDHAVALSKGGLMPSRKPPHKGPSPFLKQQFLFCNNSAFNIQQCQSHSPLCGAAPLGPLRRSATCGRAHIVCNFNPTLLLHPSIAGRAASPCRRGCRKHCMPAQWTTPHHKRVQTLLNSLPLSPPRGASGGAGWPEFASYSVGGGTPTFWLALALTLSFTFHRLSPARRGWRRMAEDSEG